LHSGKRAAKVRTAEADEHWQVFPAKKFGYLKEQQMFREEVARIEGLAERIKKLWGSL
jgi:hypothetical protein